MILSEAKMRLLFLILTVGTLICLHPCFAESATQNNLTSQAKPVPHADARKNKKGSHKSAVQHKKHKKKKVKKKHLPNIKKPHNTFSANSAKRFFSSVQQRLVQFVDDTVNTLSYSVYQWGGSHFDTSRGVYIVDCSRYVNYVLEATHPHAYFNLVRSSGSDTPNTQHYYDFITGLSDDPSRHWRRIEEVEDLQAGDILVFRNKSAVGVDAGHVMVVMDKPVSSNSYTYLVRIADSAPTRHSYDTRSRRVSGIGIGTLVLRVDPMTGQPKAYAWQVGALWKKNVKFAMARPVHANKMVA